MAQGAHTESIAQEIQLMIFNLMGTKLGIDAEQIYEVRNLSPTDQAQANIPWLHEKIPWRVTPVTYRTPRLLVSRAAGAVCCLIIDQPETILPVTIDVIRPLPSLLEAWCQAVAIWGVVLHDEEMILLVDLYKLLAQV